MNDRLLIIGFTRPCLLRRMVQKELMMCVKAVLDSKEKYSYSHEHRSCLS